MNPGTVVTCINDKALPQYAEVVKGQEYIVESSRMNNYGQRLVFLIGIRNNATTDLGLQWNGYDAKRFADPTKESIEAEEVEFAMN